VRVVLYGPTQSVHAYKTATGRELIKIKFTGNDEVRGHVKFKVRREMCNNRESG